MDDSTFTIVALVGVVVLFVSGVVLIVLGLRGRSDRLPEGATDVLDAIDAGLLAPGGRERRESVETVHPRVADHERGGARQRRDDDERGDRDPEAEDEQADDDLTHAFFSREPELERF